jgi:hypothetical protein
MPLNYRNPSFWTSSEDGAEVAAPSPCPLMDTAVGYYPCPGNLGVFSLQHFPSIR